MSVSSIDKLKALIRKEGETNSGEAGHKKDTRKPEGDTPDNLLTNDKHMQSIIEEMDRMSKPNFFKRMIGAKNDERMHTHGSESRAYETRVPKSRVAQRDRKGSTYDKDKRSDYAKHRERTDVSRHPATMSRATATAMKADTVTKLNKALFVLLSKKLSPKKMQEKLIRDQNKWLAIEGKGVKHQSDVKTLKQEEEQKVKEQTDKKTTKEIRDREYSKQIKPKDTPEDTKPKDTKPKDTTPTEYPKTDKELTARNHDAEKERMIAFARTKPKGDTIQPLTSSSSTSGMGGTPYEMRGTGKLVPSLGRAKYPKDESGIRETPSKHDVAVRSIESKKIKKSLTIIFKAYTYK